MQIIALGGEGFSDGSEPGLDLYLLEQTRKPDPRIGFIGTASGEAESYLLKHGDPGESRPFVEIERIDLTESDRGAPC